MIVIIYRPTSATPPTADRLANVAELIHEFAAALERKRRREAERPRDPLPRPPRCITYEGRRRDRPGQRPSTYG